MMDLTPRSNPVDADVCRQGLPQVEHSCLQLLTLQLHAAVLEGAESSLVLPSRLLSTLKDRVVFLATDTCVNTDIQTCAQNTLQCGKMWNSSSVFNQFENRISLPDRIQIT